MPLLVHALSMPIAAANHFRLAYRLLKRLRRRSVDGMRATQEFRALFPAAVFAVSQISLAKMQTSDSTLVVFNGRA